MSSIRKFIGKFFFLLTGLACSAGYHLATVLYSCYPVGAANTTLTAKGALLPIYNIGRNKNLNSIIADTKIEIKNQQPEGTLSNMLPVDLPAMAGEKYSTHVDASLINFDGIRLNALPAGNITREKIFEIAPFVNIIVLQNVTGTVLQQLLHLVAAYGGWPCAGMRFQIMDGKPVNISINGNAMDAGLPIPLRLQTI